MQKTHLIKTEIEETILDDIICNKCGLSCKDRMDMNYEGLIETRIAGGFASKLGDMISYQFSICENCLEEMFKTFKHDPAVPGQFEDEYE